MATNDPAVVATSLVRTFGSVSQPVRAVAGLSVEVRAGEAVALLGPSGCGKSSLLHLLGGLDRPTMGEVRLSGVLLNDLSEAALARIRRRKVGFVFQDFHLLNEMTAVENVELPALLAGVNPRAARQRALDLLDRLALSDRSWFGPLALSGGQRQRVAIARALCNQPPLILADEPTGNLDSAAGEDLLKLFLDLRRAGHALVIATHDERITAAADRVVRMLDGRIVTTDAPSQRRQ